MNVIPFSPCFTEADLETIGKIASRYTPAGLWGGWERERFPDVDLVTICGGDGLMAVSVVKTSPRRYASYGADGVTVAEGQTIEAALSPWGSVSKFSWDL